MEMTKLLSILVLVANATALNCTPSAFQAILPSNATVAYTRTIAEGGTFEVPAGDIAYPTSPTNLKALCAVQINATSSPSSSFSFGLFLPNDWNHRFLAVGNGGFAGGINWLDMAAGVGYGFATISTDTGHNSTSDDGTWAYHSPERRTDFGYRALHESIVLAKQIIRAYYNESPKYNYYSGCSTGGRQGLKEVQLFPDDFDGVLAGAPAWWTSHLQTWTIKLGLYNLPTTADYHIPEALFSVVGAEVLKQCDGQDGLVDGIVSDPDGCNFFAEALLCGKNVTNQTEIGTLYRIYSDYVDTNQTFVFPHLALGSEAQMPFLLGGNAPSTLGYEYPQYFLDLGKDWNYYDFNYSIVQLADRLDPGNATAHNFDISPFQAKGGKLLMYHGWSDALIATGSSIHFYREVIRTLKPKGIDLDSFYRFFLVPGLQHCSGTPTDVNAPWYFAGSSQASSLGSKPGSVHSVPGFSDAKHDILLALLAWTENGTAPDSIIATKWRNDTLTDTVLRQRPLCPYPKQAKYSGHGSADDASNWKCQYLYDITKQYS